MISNAASQLGDSKDQSAVEPLIYALKMLGPESPAFGFIVMALGKLGDSRGFEPLSSYLSATDSRKRAQVVYALGKLGDSRAIELLKPLTNDHGFAWEEDHGCPKYTVGDIAREAIVLLRKTGRVDGTENQGKKPWWKLL